MKFINRNKMSKNKHKSTEKEEKLNNEAVNQDAVQNEADNNSANASPETEKMTETAVEPEEQATQESSSAQANQTELLQNQIKEWQDKYLRLSADFDNYRKRTLKEKSDLIKTAGEDVISSILPVLDDFERAMTAMEKASEVTPIKEGVNLIYTKFLEILNQKGVKPIEAHSQEFNTDLHEAITKIPAPEENLKGKVVDVIQKGYLINDKVIRYAKVVVGE